MYFVDQEKIQEKLAYINWLLEQLEKCHAGSSIENLALERIIHLLIEAILDTGNMMIDGFIMRDPGSYEDIIEILVDERVLKEDEKEAYQAIIRLRKTVVTDYLNIDHIALKQTVDHHIATLKQFASRIRAYLENELKVAHAFSKNIEG